MAWPIGSKVALERVTSRVGLRSYVLCWRPLSSNPCAAGEFVKVEGLGRSGQARRGEAAFQDALWPRRKGNSSEWASRAESWRCWRDSVL